jgi:hypothetical protein
LLAPAMCRNGAPSRRLEVKPLPQRPRRSGNGIDLGGVPQIRQATHCLLARRGVEKPLCFGVCLVAGDVPDGLKLLLARSSPRHPTQPRSIYSMYLVSWNNRALSVFSPERTIGVIPSRRKRRAAERDCRCHWPKICRGPTWRSYRPLALTSPRPPLCSSD